MLRKRFILLSSFFHSVTFMTISASRLVSLQIEGNQEIQFLDELYTFFINSFQPWLSCSTHRFVCGQIPESVNIPYNQAFLEEGGLAPSPTANTLNSFKGRVIIVVGGRANYPAKVTLSLTGIVYRTQSDWISIELNPWSEFDWVRRSNEIEASIRPIRPFLASFFLSFSFSSFFLFFSFLRFSFFLSSFVFHQGCKVLKINSSQQLFGCSKGVSIILSVSFQVGGELVKLGFSKVCVLEESGLSTLRTLGNFTVPIWRQTLSLTKCHLRQIFVKALEVFLIPVKNRVTSGVKKSVILKTYLVEPVLFFGKE